MHPYFPHLVYSVALTSVATHLLVKRKSVNEERARVGAHISILESIVQRLRNDKPFADGELERLQKLAHRQRIEADEEQKSQHMSWREAFKGTKPSATSEEWDAKELEEGVVFLPSLLP